MNPYIGLTKGLPGWVQILKQEGLSFKINSPGDSPAVLIVDELKEKKEILEYLKEGGAILTDTDKLGKLLNEQTKQVNINYILPDRSPLFRKINIIDLYTKGRILEREGYGKINNKTPALYEFTPGKGHVIALPFDVSSVAADTSSRIKYFYSEHGRFPSEIVASVSKGEMRKLVVNSLRYLFRKRGLYYIHKWYYPEGKNNAFLFRVDTDESGFKRIFDTYSIAKKNRKRFTFFIDVKNLGDDIKRLKELENQEFALHCYEHRVSRDPIKNRKNFSVAKDLLAKAGLELSGLAVPYGSWNNSLATVIEQLGFRYSSEFSYSYDDLPSYPLIGKRLSTVLQIPIHPISPGTLLYAKNDIKSIQHYFSRIIEEKYERNEPLFLYGHSEIFSRFPEMLEHIIRCIEKKKNVWHGTYRDFYKWWKQRENTVLMFDLENNMLKSTGMGKSNSIFLHIITPSGKEVIVRTRESIDLSELQFKKMTKPKPFDRKMLQTKKQNLKLKLKEIEHWIKR